MLKKLNPTRIGTAAHSAAIFICAAAYLALAVGFPLPEGPRSDSVSEPFPCQRHACGCRTADHCWRSCCCMTMREKLAWARKNGVTPPDFVLAEAKREQESLAADSGCDSAQRSRRSCCTVAQGRGASGGPSVRKCCSRKHAAEVVDLEHADPQRDRGGRMNWILGVHAQKCQGLATFWVAAGAVLSPPDSIQLPAEPAPPAWCRIHWVCFWQTVSQRPDVPPPRCA